LGRRNTHSIHRRKLDARIINDTDLSQVDSQDLGNSQDLEDLRNSHDSDTDHVVVEIIEELVSSVGGIQDELETLKLKGLVSSKK
jgi:hypothetical protein